MEYKIKRYGVVLGVVMCMAQHGIYMLACAIAQRIGTDPILPKIALDNAIPIIPVFILPYIWAYLYWVTAPMAVSKCELSHFLDYIASYLLAILLGGLILIFVPTYMDRVAEGLRETSQTGFFWGLIHLWHSLDVGNGDITYNLLPSFHCINSTISYLGVCGRKEIPFWFRAYSLIITVLIYISTLFVKQHYILDVLAGIAVGLFSFVLCKCLRAGRIFLRPIALWKEHFGGEKHKK